ncbi:FIG000605: protein co-occurring with transport systems (COG1739) [hydrothermal vent metagenome]|uniref:FIG000605: protein co-occurring with transport systems (COG1739) n=1 Tax=hydrothermal vent metagenome TaxID=652676 RepID=A0A1W1BG85_9ZZZZ
MLTVDKQTTDTLIIKQSKFIAHLMPYGQFDEVLERLKAENPKARHFVTAFRMLNEYDQVVEGSSDDGEPKGTSGKPTLAVLRGADLIDIAIITVRYFGGTKLGTGGLVRAYSDATNLVIESSSLLEYHKEDSSIFECSYSDLGRVEYMLQTHSITKIDKEFGTTQVRVKISAPIEKIESFYKEAKRLVVCV